MNKSNQYFHQENEIITKKDCQSGTPVDHNKKITTKHNMHQEKKYNTTKENMS